MSDKHGLCRQHSFQGSADINLNAIAPSAVLRQSSDTKQIGEHLLGDIFRSRDIGGGAKTFWIFFVIIIPWLGLLVYLIARGKGMQERQIELAQQMQAAQASYIKSVAGASTTATDQISSAKSLLDSGAITEDEFAALKTKALALAIALPLCNSAGLAVARCRGSCSSRGVQSRW
ncbi:MAG: SHOCT domain-containing protein [Actinomycetota bacterium]|nr:SHOCT domain-containing protein [Actinomycetota bacterium]